MLLLLVPLALASPTWPAADAVLDTTALAVPEDFGVRRVALDPGHGNTGNSGLESADCTKEEDFTRALGTHFRDALVATGHFEILDLRDADAGAEYRARIDAAATWGAEALVSLHADSRGTGSQTEVEGRGSCPQNAAEPGFSVLYSDEGTEGVVAPRRALARAVAARMSGLGLPAYDGADYGNAYDADASAGVFVDRRGLFMLRRPTMPSVIFETHHAWHPEEWARWQEASTRDAAALALAQALVDVLGAP